MSNKMSMFVQWFIMHRSQIQIAITTIILVLLFLSLWIPQLRMLAEDAGGGGH
jgi:hypothetical protein